MTIAHNVFIVVVDVHAGQFDKVIRWRGGVETDRSMKDERKHNSKSVMPTRDSSIGKYKNGVW